MKKIGFIDYYLDEWHANTYPEWIRQATSGDMQVCYAYGKADAPHGMDNASWSRQQGVELLGSIADVVAASDYLVVLSPDHPEHHMELAMPALQSGKPTYVDKTFAPDRRTAQLLFETAERHGTPLFSSSALRFAKEYASVNRQGLKRICSFGPGVYSNYAVHQIEPIVALMGVEAEKVMYISSENGAELLIGFTGGRQAEIHHYRNSPFAMTLSYEAEDCVSLQAESDFFAELIKNMVQFFQTGKPPFDYRETIAIMSIIECGLQAARTPYQWVELPRG